ncbi:MAG: protein-glutamate O-methyltransferase CheR [Flavobacteriaceae bacterium]
MNPTDFQFLATFLKERSGLIVTADKLYLLESRLHPVARKFQLKGIDEITAILRSGRDPMLATAVTEAMATNETFFFRDKIPFELFKDVMLPKMLEARSSRKQIRIWCAAASTGQEPYSLSIILREMMARLAGWRFDILGTDMSGGVIEKAKSGIYSQFEVQRGLPVQLMLKYFEQKGDVWQILPEIRAMVQYRVFNLLDDYAALGKFDVVFCRNVLIYFDQPTKKRILERIADTLAPDGYLVLGAAETVVGICDAFEIVPEKRGLYRLRGAADGNDVVRPFAPLRAQGTLGDLRAANDRLVSVPSLSGR